MGHVIRNRDCWMKACSPAHALERPRRMRLPGDCLTDSVRQSQDTDEHVLSHVAIAYLHEDLRAAAVPTPASFTPERKMKCTYRNLSNFWNILLPARRGPRASGSRHSIL